MKKGIDKKKIITYTASGLIAATAALHVADSTIDHYNVYCPLNYVLSVEHQVHKINDDCDVSTFAKYFEDGYIDVSEEKAINSVADENIRAYTLSDDGSIGEEFSAIQENTITTRVYYPDAAIVVYKRDVIYPDGAQPGDIIKKSDLEYGDSEAICIIDVPKRTR